MPHGVMHEPRLHYRNIEEGLDWCNEILSCLTMLTFALEDSDIGANMDPEDHRAIWRLLTMIESTMEQIRKDYREECSEA